MANFKTRAVSKEEFELIIKTISTGFVLPDGRRVKPNERVATILTLQANLGLSAFCGVQWPLVRWPAATKRR